MENNLVLNNVNIAAEAGKNIFPSDNIRFSIKKPLFQVIFSVFSSLVFALKVIILFPVVSAYFLIGGFSGAIYLILYEKIFKTIVNSPKKRKIKSPYYYRWKNHHLEFRYET